MTILGVGIDVADPTRVARLHELRGEHFTAKWFTAAEVAECERGQDPGRSYAALLAAKEAVWKALGIRWTGAVPWLSIAIQRPATGRPASAELSGEVAAAATATGVVSLVISMSEADGLVVAVAIACGSG